jgi:hypothetical protein
MNTIDWFVFIQQEHYFVPKCFAGPLWQTGHIGGYCFQIHTQNYFKYFYHRPVNVYLRFKIAG